MGVMKYLQKICILKPCSDFIKLLAYLSYGMSPGQVCIKPLKVKFCLLSSKKSGNSITLYLSLRMKAMYKKFSILFIGKSFFSDGN